MSVDGILRVPYNLPGSRSWQWVSVYTRMSQERILFINQPLSDGVANSIVSALLYLDSEDPSKPIYPLYQFHWRSGDGRNGRCLSGHGIYSGWISSVRYAGLYQV